jgi:LPXTG-site transpeptidase (sortase) family protein
VKLSRINNILFLLIIILDLYVILAPFTPSLVFTLESHGHTKQRLETLLTKPSRPQQNASASIPSTNTLVIPSILINQPILEGSVGDQYKVLNQGIWRYPLGSTPDKGGNTILIGHRFTYTIPKGVFYFLNKLQLGDEIGIFWSKHEYLYKVSNIATVSPNDTAIENQTKKPELTLFTCTPLLLPKDRLVVVANLVKEVK